MLHLLSLNIMHTKHIIAIFVLFLYQHAWGQTFCLTMDNAQIINNGTEYQFDISMSGSSIFKLGSSNLQFGFNTSGLSTPTIVSHSLTPLIYNVPTMTLPVAGQASFNIQLNVPTLGITINTTNTWLATVKFTITNPALTSNLVWSYDGGTTQTVVYNDPQPATKLLASADDMVCLAGLNTALPLELIQFNARAQQRFIALDWQSAAERNFAGYELQRSTDGSSFEKITWIAGKGGVSKNDYRYEDQDVVPGILYYYRLKMLDTDGVFAYSAVRSARLGKAWDKPVITPNPTDGFCSISFVAPQEGSGTLEITDASGKKIMEQNIQFGSGNNNLQLDLNALTPGTYFVQLLVEGAAGQWNARVVVAR